MHEAALGRIGRAEEFANMACFLAPGRRVGIGSMN
jgi:hypothetical protein